MEWVLEHILLDEQTAYTPDLIPLLLQQIAAADPNAQPPLHAVPRLIEAFLRVDVAHQTSSLIGDMLAQLERFETHRDMLSVLSAASEETGKRQKGILHSYLYIDKALRRRAVFSLLERRPDGWQIECMALLNTLYPLTSLSPPQTRNARVLMLARLKERSLMSALISDCQNHYAKGESGEPPHLISERKPYTWAAISDVVSLYLEGTVEIFKQLDPDWKISNIEHMAAEMEQRIAGGESVPLLQEENWTYMGLPVTQEEVDLDDMVTDDDGIGEPSSEVLHEG
ncbi:hypothetical protein SAICODRAFT_28237 [Saitoella complicata NRRL Y-17804]|uniref:uncharacterized protein n=1 Tax=Saitoella complicata (strain BCRC 22490 / CBS 7301 / JCM 7358 / NBRC 10748 / NRRL Y-17804) TaxID=698492 RepID=UPI000866A634|nr:uncharacterized protein SAICODRAFT_28237 [Saitoella complicata NRRL Y-17804]ODQ49624.1 hypothetical protein SAICODRAFT_28237 [Saitoella complicata NRRL Y-17804]